MSDPVISDLGAAIRASTAPAGIATRIVAIDGQGGAGKSTLAHHLAGELGAQVVHTDDFASPDDPTEWWPKLIEKVLEPLAASLPADWEGWMAEEDAYVAREQPARHADAVLRGDTGLWR